MAMPQSDDPPTPSFLLRAARYGGQDGVSGALLEYAVMHGDEAERIRDERTGGCVGFAEGCGGRGAPALPARG